MADVAKRLYGPALLNAASTTIYTVPSNVTTVVRLIHAVNTHATTAYSFSVGVNGASSTANYQIFSGYTLPGTGVMDWSGFLVLNANDVLYANASAASVFNLMICGVEVS